ncbi:MAG: hypothetical protein AAF892_15070 [Cyanobacteria bacterium P01_D01_bin.71]
MTTFKRRAIALQLSQLTDGRWPLAIVLFSGRSLITRPDWAVCLLCFAQS